MFLISRAWMYCCHEYEFQMVHFQKTLYHLCMYPSCSQRFVSEWYQNPLT